MRKSKRLGKFILVFRFVLFLVFAKYIFLSLY